MQLQGNLMEQSEVVITFTLIMDNLLLTKQDHLELEHTKEQVLVTIIGDINADWKAGLNNSITYKNLNFKFLT
jgi:hypothetical protein